MFNKILIANRGEIAHRIINACRELGVRSVAIYAEPDTHARWVRLADESYPLAGISAAETYLNQQAVLDIAQKCGADAIHPGYGFLSENADFAAACAEAAITFVGPSPEAMRLMGDKASAREVAEAAGVPTPPGVDGAGMGDEELRETAVAIGFPVLIKASAGGGGKGMRVVWDEATFLDDLQAARSEAKNAFGDDHVILERFFRKIHHVEIQILGDEHGNLLHLFERECSIQRRHQKIVEESSAPVVQDEALRLAIAEAAIALAKEAHYTNAGTVEFIVDEEGGFYFLEMNTRLQVEHPITELVTGIDLAAWQIRIAAGERLPYKQAEIVQRGHAIECRVYAEDPANHFLPSIGEISFYQRAKGPGVRVDDGIETGMEVTPYYDPMLAKIISWGHDRDEAIRKMVRALRDTVLLGVTTNIPYLLAIFEEPHFLAGETSTDYLDVYMPNWQPRTTMTETDWLAVAVMEMMQGGGGGRTAVTGEQTAMPDPWDEAIPWRNV